MLLSLYNANIILDELANNNSAEWLFCNLKPAWSFCADKNPADTYGKVWRVMSILAWFQRHGIQL
jgi:hypothetical protein